MRMFFIDFALLKSFVRIFFPVKSLICNIRLREWAASLPKEYKPLVLSNFTPCNSSHFIASGPFSAKNSTAYLLLCLAPANKVSLICIEAESSSPTAAAIPP